MTMTTSKDQTLTPRFPPGLRSRILQPCRASLLPPITSTCQTLLVLPHSVNQTPRLTHHRLTRVVRAAAAPVLNHHNDLRGLIVASSVLGQHGLRLKPAFRAWRRVEQMPCFFGGCVGVVVVFLVPSPFFSSSSSLSLSLSVSPTASRLQHSLWRRLNEERQPLSRKKNKGEKITRKPKETRAQLTLLLPKLVLVRFFFFSFFFPFFFLFFFFFLFCFLFFQ